MRHGTFVNRPTSGTLSGNSRLLSQALTYTHRFHLYSLTPSFPDLVHLLEVCSSAMANFMHVGIFVAFLVTLLSLPGSSVCARVMGAAVAESSYSTIASPMAEYCATDFSQVSYEDVKAACPAGADQGANAACCAAFNRKACQYEAQVNNFGSMCPMLFINYLGAVGPYPAGYFVGPCVDGTKGFCVR